MPLYNLAELQAISEATRANLRKQNSFLSSEQVKKLASVLRDETISFILKPAESLEQEAKHKLSNASAEMSRAIEIIELLRKNHNKDHLRLAKTNLDESASEIAAAKKAIAGLRTYQKRVEKASAPLGTELSEIIYELEDVQKNFEEMQKNFYLKILME